MQRSAVNFADMSAVCRLWPWITAGSGLAAGDVDGGSGSGISEAGNLQLRELGYCAVTALAFDRPAVSLLQAERTTRSRYRMCVFRTKRYSSPSRLIWREGHRHRVRCGRRSAG